MGQVKANGCKQMQMHHNWAHTVKAVGAASDSSFPLLCLHVIAQM